MHRFQVGRVKRPSPPVWLRVLLLIVIGVGICFRFVNLDRKVYWHDEAYTSLRAAGYTRAEIDSTLFQNVFLAAPQLQRFQQIKPESTIGDTLHSLATEDPQHPPLYFLLARFWMRLFGGSILAARSLPALLSLLSLPLIYLLALELFRARFLALLATALLAVSPFDILFAQTARQYGLLTTAVIASSWLLLRALRLQRSNHWTGYSLSLAVGLYTHPFFGLTLIAHAAYLGLASQIRNRQQNHPELGKAAAPERGSPIASTGSGLGRMLLPFAVATGAALILFSPWLHVLVANAQRAADTTDWSRVHVSLLYLIQFWLLSFTALFCDLNFGPNLLWTGLSRLPFVLLIVAALYVVYQRTPPRIWLFIFTSVLVPFLLLVLPDLILGGKRSAVSRYLISCYPGIQLAVAYLLAVGIATGKPFWRWLLAGVLAIAIASCGLSAVAVTWWDKDLSYFNAEVAAIVNARAERSSPVLVSDIGTDYTNMGDLISLSYLLKDNVRLYTVNRPPNLDLLSSETDVMVFRGSKELFDAVAAKGWQLEILSAPGRLWQLRM